jgi:ATP-dependent Clp protease ATP-binding subunit ClpX
VQVDTTNILFVCGGAFDGLGKIIRQRTAKTGIGFGAEVTSPDDRKDIGVAARMRARGSHLGLIPEFVGRLPVVATRELDESALIQILVEPKNALSKQYQKMFRMEGVELEIRDGALRAIAGKASAREPAHGSPRRFWSRFCSTSCTTSLAEQPRERDRG